jgi:hypothetical protein
MLSIAKTSAEEKELTGPTIVEIAREISLGAQLQMAELKLSKLRAEREALGPQLNAMIEEHRSGRLPATAVHEISAAAAAIDEKIREARPLLSELRKAQANRVAEELAPYRVDAAKRLVAATDELNKAYLDLRDCCEEVRRAGDAEQPYFHAPAIGPVLNLALKIAATAK